MKTTPTIFTYDNYRKFLRDYYRWEKKKSNGAFSYRFFSRKAGFATSNLLLLVMQGKRNLTHDSIEKFAAALRLNKREVEYFRALVFYTQSTEPKDKIQYFKKMLAFREYRNARCLSEEHIEYFSKWYYPAIRELINVKGFKFDPSWVAQQLRYEVKPSEAKEALDLLQILGLIIQDPSGRWVQTEKHLIGDGSVHKTALTIFHREMIGMGRESLKDPTPEREISSVTMSISRGQFDLIKEKIALFEKDIQGVVANNDADENIDRVCQLNFQLFHLAEVKEKRGVL